MKTNFEVYLLICDFFIYDLLLLLSKSLLKSSGMSLIFFKSANMLFIRHSQILCFTIILGKRKKVLVRNKIIIFYKSYIKVTPL